MPAASIVTTTILQKKKKAEQERRDREAAGLPPEPERIVVRKPTPEPKPEGPPKALPVRLFNLLMDVLGSTSVQTILFMVFVVVFQSLSETMRMAEEYYFDNHVMDRIVENHFDSSHNTFNSMRRIADVYEWGNNVMLPGLFADAGPCTATVGSATIAKTCNDMVWPDGEGSFHLDGATPLSVPELVERMDQFDWTDGVAIYQTRSEAGTCSTTSQLGECFPEYQYGGGSRAPFGYNKTHPSLPPSHQFEWHSAGELGADPAGFKSAAIPSQKLYHASGYVAIIRPFFSDTYLTYEEGLPSQVTNFRSHEVTTTNGRAARYHCVRTSTNGKFLKQLCDPGSNGDGTGRLTGAVRAHVETFWNDLKRAHFLDARTRAVTIVMQLKSNHIGLRYRISLMVEQSSVGNIFPSYDVETMMLDSDKQTSMRLYATIGLGMVLFFCMTEGVELASSGPHAYFKDVWNVMDWLNFALFFLTFNQVMAVHAALANPDCSSYLCTEVGYFDDYKLMSEFRATKLYLSLCVCIQLLKILKFADQIIPKMGLATSVLRICVLDLIFFGFSFIISMFAFSMMLYVQLGPVMGGFVTQEAAFVSLFRALFGDFDIDEIMDNSSGYLNTYLFLMYLFVAIFIMLSMFLAILAEAQVKARENEAKRKEDNPEFKEFGALEVLGGGIVGAVGRCRKAFSPPKPAMVGDGGNDGNDGAGEAEQQQKQASAGGVPLSTASTPGPSAEPPPSACGAGAMSRQLGSSPDLLGPGACGRPPYGASYSMTPMPMTNGFDRRNGEEPSRLLARHAVAPLAPPSGGSMFGGWFGGADATPVGRGSQLSSAASSELTMLTAAVRELCASQAGMQAEVRRQREEIRTLSEALATRMLHAQPVVGNALVTHVDGRGPPNPKDQRYVC